MSPKIKKKQKKKSNSGFNFSQNFQMDQLEIYHLVSHVL